MSRRQISVFIVFAVAMVVLLLASGLLTGETAQIQGVSPGQIEATATTQAWAAQTTATAYALAYTRDASPLPTPTPLPPDASVMQAATATAVWAYVEYHNQAIAVGR